MKRGMYLAAALCLLLCGCGKKDAAEAQAVQQRYAALTGAVAEAEIVSHPEGETRSFTVRCTCDRTKDTATTTVMAPEELAGQSVIGSMFQKNTEPSSKVIRLTLNAFTDISADWLLRNKGPMLISDIKPDPNIERMERLVDTIATLQGTINEQMKTIQLFTEENQKLKGELAMLKNERNIG